MILATLYHYVDEKEWANPDRKTGNIENDENTAVFLKPDRIN
jgi:hypothetical protein